MLMSSITTCISASHLLEFKKKMQKVEEKAEHKVNSFTTRFALRSRDNGSSSEALVKFGSF